MRKYFALPRTVYILCVGTFINRAGTLLLPFLTLYLRDRLSLSVEVATRLMGAYGAGAILASLMGGHLADRFGRKRVMVASLAGGACILGVFPLLRSVWLVAGGLLVFAAIGEMYRPATQAMVADCVDNRQRPTAYALLYVSVNLGFAVAPILGGTLVHSGFRWLCWVDGLTALVYAGILMLSVEETRPHFTGPTGSASADATQLDARHTGIREAASVLAHDGAMLSFCASTLAIAMVFMQMASTFPLYLQQLGIDAKHYGRIIAVNGLMITFLQLPFTALIENRRRDVAVVLSAVVIGTGFWLNSFARTPVQFALIVVVWTWGEMLHAAFASAIVADLAPVHLRGRYMGLFSMCFSSAHLLGVPLGGFVLGRLGSNALWTGALLLGLAAAALYLLAFAAMRRRVQGTTVAAGATSS